MQESFPIRRHGDEKTEKHPQHHKSDLSLELRPNKGGEDRKGSYTEKIHRR